ncbi:MAG: PAS domain S-box protein, partial [Candidatus Eremiobacteraeota bacterium]|nr:PAS domain S-box protein [Candidatus Eremiobacteraeota bacterium]
MRAAVAAACTLVIGFAVEDMRRRAVSTKASGRLEAGEEAQRVRRLERMKAALRRAQERLSALSEALPFGMWELDGAGSQIVHASDSYCQLFGMNMEEIAAHGWRERVPPDDAERFLSAWNARGDDDIFEGESSTRPTTSGLGVRSSVSVWSLQPAAAIPAAAASTARYRRMMSP